MSASALGCVRVTIVEPLVRTVTVWPAGVLTVRVEPEIDAMVPVVPGRPGPRALPPAAGALVLGDVPAAVLAVPDPPRKARNPTTATSTARAAAPIMIGFLLDASAMTMVLSISTAIEDRAPR
jgi:hypothetical protein